MDNTTPHCCHPDCDKAATHWVGVDDRDQYTHSCPEHIDDLQGPADVVVLLNPRED